MRLFRVNLSHYVLDSDWWGCLLIFALWANAYVIKPKSSLFGGDKPRSVEIDTILRRTAALLSGHVSPAAPPPDLHESTATSSSPGTWELALIAIYSQSWAALRPPKQTLSKSN